MYIPIAHLLNAFEIPENVIQVGGHFLHQVIEYKQELEWMVSAIVYISETSEDVPIDLDIDQLTNDLKEFEKRLWRIVNESNLQSLEDETLDEKTKKIMNLLIQKMRECLMNPTKENINEFKYLYAENADLSEIIIQSRGMGVQGFGILYDKMKADHWRQRATFDAHMNTMKIYLAKFILIDVFASKLMKKDFGGLTIRRSKYLLNRMSKNYEYWVKMCLDNGEWDLEEALNLFKFQQLHRSLKEKADELKRLLDNSMTNDAFYILVFKDPQELKIHKAIPEQLAASFETGKCSIVIYRSRRANNIRQTWIQDIQENAIFKQKWNRDLLESKDMEFAYYAYFEYRNQEQLNRFGIYEKIAVENSLLNKECVEMADKFPNIGFSANLFGKEVHIRHANYTGTEGQPGYSRWKRGILRKGEPVQLGTIFGYV